VCADAKYLEKCHKIAARFLQPDFEIFSVKFRDFSWHENRLSW
jgi:hypothetical protein